MTFAARTMQDAAAGGGSTPPATFIPVTHLFQSVGTFVETIPHPPAGQPVPTQLVIELGGSGGGGSFSPKLGDSPPLIAGSGGSGSLCRFTFALAPTDLGATFNVTISPGADGGDPVVQFKGRDALPCTITSGSFATPVNMQAGGGQGGSWPIPGVQAGAGGIASGGQVNVNGNAGQGGQYYPTPSHGGVPILGNYIASGAGGDASAVYMANGSPGHSGAAAFAYS